VVTLSGDVLASEVEGLIAASLGAWRLPRRKSASRPRKARRLPTLRGNSRKPHPRFELLQSKLVSRGKIRDRQRGNRARNLRHLERRHQRDCRRYGRRWSGWPESLTNMELKRLVGAEPGCCVDVQKTLHIAAPVEKVYEFWSNYENFPRFMSHLKEVHEIGPDAHTGLRMSQEAQSNGTPKLLRWSRINCCLEEHARLRSLKYWQHSV